MPSYIFSMAGIDIFLWQSPSNVLEKWFKFIHYMYGVRSWVDIQNTDSKVFLEISYLLGTPVATLVDALVPDYLE